jgi:hypothetical protein
VNDLESDDNLDWNDGPQNSFIARPSCVARPRIGKRLALAIEPRIAPIERFEIPLHLDGSDGDFRCAVDPCHIQVTTDLEAIDWWLTRTSQTETTMAARRAAVEKLINWAIIVRKRAISSLTETDFAAFSRFLSDPQPSEKWIYPGQVSRASDAWRPFKRPLSAGARDGTMRQVSALVKWMMSVRYADLRFLFGVRVMNDGFATSALAQYGEAAREPDPPISVAEWHEIRKLLDERYPAKDVTSQRLLVELLYYGNYFITDLAKLSKGDVEPPNRVVPCWTVHLRGPGWRHDEVFFTPPPLSDTIARWMSAGTSGPYGFLQFQYNPRVTQFLDIGPDRMRAQVTQVLHHASRRALEHGNEAVGLRLRDRGVTSFRGAFRLHQRHPAYDPDALNLTSQIEFNPDLLLQLLRRPGKRLLWDWSHAEHLWTDAPARSDQHAA